MGFLLRLLGLESDDPPVPMTAEGFSDLMQKSFPRHLKATDAVVLPEGGVRVIAHFKNGLHLAEELRSPADVKQFLKKCGMIYEL